RTIVDAPVVAVLAPDAGQCVPARGGELIIAAELAAGATVATARLDCATPFELRPTGGWNWRAELPPLSPGRHTVAVVVAGSDGTRATTATDFDVCTEPSPPVASGSDW